MQAGPCCGLSPPRPRLGRGFGWVLQHPAPPPARGTGNGGHRQGGGSRAPQSDPWEFAVLQPPLVTSCCPGPGIKGAAAGGPNCPALTRQASRGRAASGLGTVGRVTLGRSAWASAGGHGVWFCRRGSAARAGYSCDRDWRNLRWKMGAHGGSGTLSWARREVE